MTFVYIVRKGLNNLQIKIKEVLSKNLDLSLRPRLHLWSKSQILNRLTSPA